MAAADAASCPVRILGIDFPFCQAREFIAATGSPGTWPHYADQAAFLGR